MLFGYGFYRSRYLFADFYNNKNRKSFTDSDAIQSNGKHKLISNMRHEIYYDDGVKKSRGMTLIDYETVKSAIDSML